MSPVSSVKATRPFDSPTTPSGPELGVGTGYSVIFPLVVETPILSALYSEKARAPVEVAAITRDPADAVGMRYSVSCPPSVILAILLAFISTNQTFPSGPRLGPWGNALAVGVAN